MPESYTPKTPRSITADDYERFATPRPPEHWSTMTVAQAEQTGGLYIPGLDITPTNAEALIKLAERMPVDHNSGQPMPLSFNPETGVFMVNMPEGGVIQDPGEEAATIIKDLTDACTTIAHDNGAGTKRPISIVSLAPSEGWHTDSSSITNIDLNDRVLQRPSMRMLAALNINGASFATRSHVDSTTRLMDKDLSPADIAFFEENANTAELYKMICFDGLEQAHTGRILESNQLDIDAESNNDAHRVIFNYWNGRN